MVTLKSTNLDDRTWANRRYSNELWNDVKRPGYADVAFALNRSRNQALRAGLSMDEAHKVAGIAAAHSNV